VKRVLQVYEPREGGVPEHVLQLSMGLKARGWAVDVAGPAGSPFMPRFDDLGVAVHRLPLERGSVAGDLKAARQLREVDRAKRFDVVHAHSSKAGALVRAAIGGGRVVYSPHCFAFNRETGLPIRVFTWAVEQALVPRTRAVVAACDWERRQGSRALRGVARRTDVIEYGVEPCDGVSPDTGLREFAGSGPLVGWCARSPRRLTAALPAGSRSSETARSRKPSTPRSPAAAWRTVPRCSHSAPAGLGHTCGRSTYSLFRRDGRPSRFRCSRR